MSIVRRLSHNQPLRTSVYCLGDRHLTITDPQHPWSGDEHKLEFATCDCATASAAAPTDEPSTPTGEGSDEHTGSESGADGAATDATGPSEPAGA